ncbi:hypothetical protein KM043_002344 [Ampulex compressa]|nr:hypothetical protein KM043_002344 [Ampulex compressa]
MFQSKISPLLKNIISNTQHDTIKAGYLPWRLLSTNNSEVIAQLASMLSIQEVKPDKLYKKIAIEVRGNDKAVLKSYAEFAITAATHLEIPVGKHYTPYKPEHRRLTLLKSVHIYKKHRVQYEYRTYYRFIDFLQLTGSTADTFLEYIERNLPEGVAMKVTKVELQKLPDSVTRHGE